MWNFFKKLFQKNYCSDCNENITEGELNFSTQHGGKPLCIRCQRARKRSTPEAKKIGDILAKRWKIELEKYDGYKHIDISIPGAKVDIEVDGKQHNLDERQALADLKRTFYSFKKGWLTLRISNCLVRNDQVLKRTADYIDKFLSESADQLDDYDGEA